MDIAALPFDTDAMLAGLKTWVECESPTFDTAAVNRMLDLASRDLAMMGATLERIPGRLGLADVVRARMPHPRQGEPGILILAHFDTVHPVGTLAKLPFRREGDRCFGPGICDMKGGSYLTFEALRVLARVGHATPLPVTLLLTGDEEIGTPSARDVVEAEARRNRYVLVPEPGLANGGCTSGRYAIARFNIATTGKPSHAGARLSDGRSAIREMCRRIMEIEALTGEDCTFSVGVFHAGQWVNCVSSRADAEVLSMAKRQQDLDSGVAKMLAMASDAGEVTFSVTRGVTRPVWEPDAGTLALYERMKALAASIGVETYHQSSGGGSDGNFTGAMGIPTLDGLGVEGGGYHTLQEFIHVPTLANRGRIMAGLLGTLV
jgi:glutamate carboxypeptidase